MNKLFLVRTEWDPQAGVWVATSDDVPGLVTESQSIETLKGKLQTLIPELLQANSTLPPEFEIQLELINHGQPQDSAKEPELIPLSVKDQECVAQAFESPTQPSPALERAFARHSDLFQKN